MSQMHQSMRCLAASANTVLPCNKSVYWRMIWWANLCLLQGVRCRLWQCCPWLILSGSRSVGRGQPQIFSRPSLCLGRTAVILILLLIVVLVVFPHINQFWHVLCTDTYQPLCLYWTPIHVLVLTPLSYTGPSSLSSSVWLATALCAVIPVYVQVAKDCVKKGFWGEKMLLESNT